MPEIVPDVSGVGDFIDAEDNKRAATIAAYEHGLALMDALWRGKRLTDLLSEQREQLQKLRGEG